MSKTTQAFGELSQQRAGMSHSPMSGSLHQAHPLTNRRGDDHRSPRVLHLSSDLRTSRREQHLIRWVNPGAGALAIEELHLDMHSQFVMNHLGDPIAVNLVFSKHRYRYTTDARVFHACK